MAQGKKYVNFILDKNEIISDFIAQISDNMYEYIETHKSSNFILFYKYLTHSDLATFGKATSPNSLNKNLLYYLTVDEMKEIESKTRKPFQTAHQSCIGLMKKWYDMVGLPQPRENDPYLINDFCNVYLSNDNMRYFTAKYTKIVFKNLNKVIPTEKKSWNFSNIDIHLSDGKFTPIELHCAVHGLGMEQDEDFHKLRHHLFKSDTFIILFEINSQEKNMFLLFEKNPAFFSIIGETNKVYENYQKKTRDRLISKLTGKDNAISNLDEEVTRQQQNTWRQMLAKEMMGYTSQENIVFCPFTYLTANFNKLGTLFVASHIKGFSDPNTKDEEKYDINNGLLLSANADALFDKHLITINTKKQLVFSFLLDGEILLKQQLFLLQPIFQPLLNDKRMAYLKYHQDLFNILENKRKTL